MSTVGHLIFLFVTVFMLTRMKTTFATFSIGTLITLCTLLIYSYFSYLLSKTMFTRLRYDYFSFFEQTREHYTLYLL